VRGLPITDEALLNGTDGWLEPFQRAWAAKLTDLKRFVEDEPGQGKRT
jgi:hypothetical protein